MKWIAPQEAEGRIFILRRSFFQGFFSLESIDFKKWFSYYDIDNKEDKECKS